MDVRGDFLGPPHGTTTSAASVQIFIFFFTPSDSSAGLAYITKYIFTYLHFV